jgi:hypothetical protein
MGIAEFHRVGLFCSDQADGTDAARDARTVQFAGMAAFHTRISDPAIGGTYMTLLITFSNLGQTWPKWFVLRGVDYFTKATCSVVPAVDILQHGACFR